MLSRLIVVMLAAAPVAKLSPAPEIGEGPWAQELRFTDKAGEHLVRFELGALKTRKAEEDMEERSRLLTIVHTVGKKEVWRAKDFVEKCPFDLELGLIDGSIEVTDLDGDGEAEVSFLYKLTCRSDVSPLTAKLLLYEGPTKYALRGDTRERVGENEFFGGEFTVDPAFEKAPKGFLDFARGKWKRLIVDAAR